MRTADGMRYIVENGITGNHGSEMTDERHTDGWWTDDLKEIVDWGWEVKNQHCFVAEGIELFEAKVQYDERRGTWKAVIDGWIRGFGDNPVAALEKGVNYVGCSLDMRRRDS